MVPCARFTTVLQIVGGITAFFVLFAVVYLMIVNLSAPPNLSAAEGDLIVEGRVISRNGFYTTSSPSNTSTPTFNNSIAGGLNVTDIVIHRPGSSQLINVADELASLQKKVDDYEARRLRRKQELEACAAQLDIGQITNSESYRKSLSEGNRLINVESLLICIMLADPETFECIRPGSEGNARCNEYKKD